MRLFTACADPLPQVFGHDPQSLVLGDVPLGFRLLEPAAPPCSGIPARLGLVPDPPSLVLLVVKNSTDGCRRPAFCGPNRRRDAVLIQDADILVSGSPLA